MALDSFLSLWSIIWRFAVDWACAAIVLRCLRKANRMTKFKTNMPIRMQKLCKLKIIPRMRSSLAHKPNAHPESMKYAQHAILSIQTRLFVTLTRYWRGVTKANTLSTVRSRTCPALTSTKTEKAFSTGKVRFLFWKMAQPQYTINGHTTTPTRRSAIAIKAMMRLDGKDLSFFSGSFQTDKTTSKSPQTITGDRTIEGIKIVIDMVFEFPPVSQTSPKTLKFQFFWSDQYTKAVCLVIWVKLKCCFGQVHILRL